MKNILCYGDSNTWGFIPGKFNYETMTARRYPKTVRWTGLLQKLLGENYFIYEEGLNARTTNLDYSDLAGLNGKTYLLPCLYSHAPLDLVIIMLGCNDLKNCFHNSSAQEISLAIGELCELIQSKNYGPDLECPPQILIIGHPILAHERGFDNSKMFENGVARSKEFDKYFSLIAKKYGCHYFNAAPHIELSDIDGIHFDEKSHKIFAEFMEIEIKKIFG